MSRFVEITFQEGSAQVTKIINLDMVVDFNFAKRKLVVCYGQATKLYVLTSESAVALHQGLFVGGLNDPWTIISQLQQDISVYDAFCCNVIGWINGAFREKKSNPYMELSERTSQSVNDVIEVMAVNLQKLNDEYLSMKARLEEAGISVNNHGIDPNNQ